MYEENTKINKNLIEKPIVNFTQRAVEQLKLILENDFTLSGKYFRILISGKGCDGFTYSVGLTDLAPDDFQIPINNSSEEFEILMDPFTAFYVPECSVDFIQDFDQEAEGFVVTNHLQKKFSGKFWKARPDLVVPTNSESTL